MCVIVSEHDSNPIVFVIQLPIWQKFNRPLLQELHLFLYKSDNGFGIETILQPEKTNKYFLF